MVDQHFGECLSVLGGKHKPATYGLVLVAGDLLGRPKAAPAHHHQECSAYLFGRCAQPLHRGVVSLTEPGAATSAMVALRASQRAVAHYVSSRTIGIGTGRFGICGTHLEPLADLTDSHILQESLPNFLPPIQIVESICYAAAVAVSGGPDRWTMCFGPGSGLLRFSNRHAHSGTIHAIAEVEH
jgi:hypothetical protein